MPDTLESIIMETYRRTELPAGRRSTQEGRGDVLGSLEVIGIEDRIVIRSAPAVPRWGAWVTASRWNEAFWG